MLEIINPADEKVIGAIACDDAESVARKVASARDAQAAWALRPVEERAGILRRFGDLVRDRVETLAKLLTREVGKPITQSRAEVLGTLDRLAFFLKEGPERLNERLVHTEADGGLEERITREPLGVVANISAWNYPWFVGANVFLPALLMGNAVLYKPSEHAALVGQSIAQLLWEAGVPHDVFTLIVGPGALGQTLLEQPLDGVFFTGSLKTGEAIARQVAPRMVKLQMELGGKDPVYVCDDVDVESVAAGIADGAFYNSGQSCCAVERIYVHERIYDAFVASFLSTVKGFVIGEPQEESAYIGPLARRAQLTFLRGQVEDAVAKGARVACGGKPIDRVGFYFEPTVLLDVDHTMSVMTEESFGPIIGIQSVSSDEFALERMNDTRYGLTAGVFSADRRRAERILAGVRAGSAYWNCCDRVSPRLPWSGRGLSGVGVTLSEAGIDAFTQPKAWHLRR